MVANLMKTGWICEAKSTRVERTEQAVKVVNDGDKVSSVRIGQSVAYDGYYCKVFFEGRLISGNAAVFELRDLDAAKQEVDMPQAASLNSTSIFSSKDTQEAKASLILPPHSETLVTRLDLEFFDDEAEKDNFQLCDMKSDVLVITPSYPAPENFYLAGFVHSRVSAYRRAGLEVDVVCALDYRESCKYTFEGIEVLRTSFSNLRVILRRRKYRKILVHFFDERYALALDTCDLGNAEILLWCHNPEVCYWDSPKYAQRYFEKEDALSQEQMRIYRIKDEVVKRYNGKPNVSWVFISDAQRKKAESLIGIEFNRYHVIPNVVDENEFPYAEKDPELRKRVYVCRRFDNLASYSIDTCVRAVVELSRRACFADMEFDFYGYGDFYEELVEPLRRFANVHLHPRSITHDEMSRIHSEHGIALFPTRYDSQGVSAGEAAMSGLAVISSDIGAAKCFLPDDMELLQPVDNYIKYADCMEKLYNDPAYFQSCSKACHEKAYKLCRTEMTTEKEIALINAPSEHIASEPAQVPRDENPSLTVVVPAYNVQEYLAHGISTLMGHPYVCRLDIIIVNDGSSDGTAEVAASIAKRYNDPAHPVIRVINKENGGHGSTINTGLDEAQGKYFKVMDGDDWFDTSEFIKLLEALEDEDSDIVLCDYSEDKAEPSLVNPARLYDFMILGLKYRVDDVCTGKYGFQKSGPILATGCFKTKMLRDVGCRLTEHCFYVDIEFDVFAIQDAETLTYYPYDVYRYFIGRAGQSTSARSFIKNRKDRHRMLVGILEYLDAHPEISHAKRMYVLHNLIIPCARDQYMFVAEVMKSTKDYLEFDSDMARWPEVYNDPVLATPFYRFHRKTKGRFLKQNDALVSFNSKVRRGSRRK